MKSRFLILAVCAVIFGVPNTGFAQKQGGQTEQSTSQRLDVMDSRLDLMRRSLSSAIKAIGESNDKEKDKKANADDPVVRLKGLEKEVGSMTGEIADIRSKSEKGEKFDATAIDRLETSVKELGVRVETGLQETASLRKNASSGGSNDKKKKKGRFFGLFGGGDDKYAD